MDNFPLFQLPAKGPDEVSGEVGDVGIETGEPRSGWRYFTRGVFRKSVVCFCEI